MLDVCLLAYFAEESKGVALILLTTIKDDWYYINMDRTNLRAKIKQLISNWSNSRSQCENRSTYIVRKP